MKKYLPLHQYLKKNNETHINLQFEHIEKILNDKLPASASTYRAWWSNGGHIQADAWLQANWRVSHVRLGKYVEFVKNVNIT
jgi:hypothetical protein